MTYTQPIDNLFTASLQPIDNLFTTYLQPIYTLPIHNLNLKCTFLLIFLPFY